MCNRAKWFVRKVSFKGIKMVKVNNYKNHLIVLKWDVHGVDARIMTSNSVIN